MRRSGSFKYAEGRSGNVAATRKKKIKRQDDIDMTAINVIGWRNTCNCTIKYCTEMKEREREREIVPNFNNIYFNARMGRI